MGRSFYLSRTLADLAAKSQKFSDDIATDYAALGLTQAMAQAYATVNDNFITYYNLAKNDETRTKGTVQGRRDAQVLLVAKASELAKIIEANPAVSNETKIDLGLSVRATPQPSPAPGTCSDFKTELQADGSVKSSWKANNPKNMTGVTYQVWRRFGSEGEFEYHGACGVKEFIDSEIPAGTKQVQYQVRGIRPTGAGEWAQFNVNFGKTSGGETTASAVETQVSPRKAA